jgi:hypothetical protein
VPLEPKEKKTPALQLTEIDKKLRDIYFSAYGAIYFRRDLKDGYTLPELAAVGTNAHPADSEFCLGPITRRDFWWSERGSIDINRGPCE